MQHFRKITEGYDVAPVVEQLAAYPDLWGEHPERVAYPDSPHRETQDIWLRFRDPADLRHPTDYGNPHFAVFYPAWHKLPAVHPIVFDLMARERAVYLGGILMTRLPPRSQVYRHHDRGSWHAEYLNRKVYVILQGNPWCTNWCEDETLVMRPGDAWEFENLLDHGVINEGLNDRLALIVTMRCDQ